MHPFNPSTREAEGRGISESSRLGWCTEQVPGQAPKLQGNPVSKKQTKENKTTETKNALALAKALPTWRLTASVRGFGALFLPRHTHGAQTYI